jgi:hypothetical protein
MVAERPPPGLTAKRPFGDTAHTPDNTDAKPNRFVVKPGWADELEYSTLYHDCP